MGHFVEGFPAALKSFLIKNKMINCRPHPNKAPTEPCFLKHTYLINYHITISEWLVNKEATGATADMKLAELTWPNETVAKLKLQHYLVLLHNCLVIRCLHGHIHVASDRQGLRHVMNNSIASRCAMYAYIFLCLL